MGNVNLAECTLSTAEIEQLNKATVFTPEEIKLLWFHFKTINSYHETITRSQFQVAMLFKDSALLDRIFRVFDLDDDNQISFLEYLTCLSIISSKAPKEEKLKFSFQIYDFDGDDFISSADLTAVTAATLREHNIPISRQEIDTIVDNTMKEARTATPNMISFAEYKSLVGARPHMLAQLTINISGIIAEYTSTPVVALSTPRGFASAMNVKNAATRG